MVTITGPDNAQRDQARLDAADRAAEPWEVDWFEPERKGSFLGSFSRDDAKLLQVTFAGTVAANVVTAIAGRHAPRP
jgi:hypothetical protein